jgi:transglutaminase-like putative cysteine protease
MVLRCVAVLVALVAAGGAGAQGSSPFAPGQQQKVRSLVDALMQATAQADPQRAAKVQALKEQLESLGAHVARVRADLAAERARLKGKPGVMSARQDELESEFDRRASQFDAAARGWLANPSESNLAQIRKALQDPAAASSLPPLPAVLPWGSRAQPRPPAETTTSWFRLLTRDQRVQLAQSSPLATVGGVRFTSLPEPGQAPVDADLAETPEIQLTPAIRAQAQALAHSPVNILNWVRANVHFVPSWGSLRTAEATLQARRGNAIDTATLTIALLRASGIPARYQFGTIDVPAAAAGRWIGGVERPEAVVQMLQEGGIAARGIASGGQVATIRMEHAWASAYVNWSPSRGSRDGGHALLPPQHPNPNAALNAWVPLDASFKQYARVAGLNVDEVAPFNAAGAIEAARQQASCSAASARNVSQAALAAHHAQFKAQAIPRWTRCWGARASRAGMNLCWRGRSRSPPWWPIRPPPRSRRRCDGASSSACTRVVPPCTRHWTSRFRSWKGSCSA